MRKKINEPYPINHTTRAKFAISMLSAFFGFWTVFYSIWLQVDADPLSLSCLNCVSTFVSELVPLQSILKYHESQKTFPWDLTFSNFNLLFFFNTLCFAVYSSLLNSVLILSFILLSLFLQLWSPALFPQWNVSWTSTCSFQVIMSLTQGIFS